MESHTQHTRRRFIRSVGSLGALFVLDAPRVAAAPTQIEQLHILCGFAAGGIPDSVARRIGDQLAGGLARSVIVENHAGAAGQIAVSVLRLAPADGSTMLLAPGAVATIYPYVYKKLAYDPLKDLQPVSVAAEASLALAVGPAVPESVRTVGDFLGWCRANPKLANFGSPGTGTPPHLLGALLVNNSGVALLHVPYNGGAPAVIDLLGGQIASLILPEGLLRQHHAARKLRVLATSGKRRSSFLPHIATFLEQGFRDIAMLDWFAFFMSARSPAASVNSAAEAIRTAIGQPELAAAFAELGLMPVASSPAELAARIAAEQRYWAPLIRSAGITVES